MVYITGEREPIANICDSENPNAVLKELCEYNSHLDQRQLRATGYFPSYTPLRYPDQPTIRAPLPHEKELQHLLHLSPEMRMRYRLVHRNPEPFFATKQIVEDLAKAHESFVKNWENPLSPFEVAFPLGAFDEFTKQGSKALQSHPSYITSQDFLRELFLKDSLGQRYNHLKKVHGPSHPAVRTALSDFNWQRQQIHMEFANEIKRLSPKDQKMLRSPGYGLKMYRQGGTDFKLNLSSKIGHPYPQISFEKMEMLTRHSETIGKSIVGLGAIAAGVDSYAAMQRGEDKYRPIVKWYGGIQGGLVGAEGAVMFTGMATTALTGISGEVITAVLVCTPYGWIPLAVICAAGAYVGSQYGEEIALGVYDTGMKLAAETERIIKESWDSICDYAENLWSRLFK